MKSNETLRVAAAGVLVIATLWAKPAQALDNPLSVTLRGPRSHIDVATGSVLGSGSNVLVDVTRYRAVLNGAAVTLNTGTCKAPGTVAYRLAPFTKDGSITELRHSLAEVAARARSMSIHQTASASSATVACGNVID
jgi:hypothetical protein